jgi:PAT family beta-lactamase induction signal transducer AmpG
VASTYFAEGLPFSIVRQISSQYFTAMGASLPAVGLTSLYNFAWNFKLLWSPLVDRYGTVRRWLLVTELLLGLVVAAIAWPAGLADLPAVARALVVVAFLAATHDIAIDGFYLGALDKRAQTQLSGLRVSAYRAALLVGNGLLVILAGIASWRVVFAVAGALLVALAGAHALWLPRPARPARPVPAETPGATAPDYLEAFASFFRQPDIGVSLAFILLFNAGDSLMFAMNAPFLKSLGFLERGRGALSTLGTVVFIVGSISSAAAIARYGLRRVLPRVAAVQSLAILLYVALAVTRPAMPWVAAAAVVEQLVVGVASPAFSVFLMRRCGAEHRAAHFAIATALMSVASTGAGAVSGYVAEPLGYPTFFAIAFMASLPGVALSWLVPRE